jgi:hypothetical protein
MTKKVFSTLHSKQELVQTVLVEGGTLQWEKFKMILCTIGTITNQQHVQSFMDETEVTNLCTWVFRLVEKSFPPTE